MARLSVPCNTRNLRGTMLHFVFTIDGDWGEYFDISLSEEERAPKKETLQDLIRSEIKLTGQTLEGRFIHFIHTSPRARDFFLESHFLKLWKEILKNDGDVGLHCHEDDPYRHYYCQDTSRMKRVISEQVKIFRNAGLSLNCYRGGFLGFSSEMVRILEANDIYFDFSCEPGRFLTHEGSVISDWRGAPQRHYRMSYDNHRKPGHSKVWEIPVGASEGKYLYFEKISLGEIEKIGHDLKEISIKNKCDIIVSVLSHTYEYSSLDKIQRIEEKIVLLKKYGAFINLKELQGIIS
ncbi:hypothetical protein ACFL0P_01180 [Candidatus Omnitrophota bacterium]